MSAQDYVVVYRGFDLAGLDLIEALLRAEGLAPRRVGKTTPSLLGLGNAAVEQLIAVAPEHEQAALSLIASSQPAPGEPAQVDDLEAQALSAAPGRPDSAREDAAARGLDVRVIALIVAIAIAIFFALK